MAGAELRVEADEGDEGLESWERDGFALLRSFVDTDMCRVMHERIVDVCRTAAAGSPIGDSIVDPERNSWAGATDPEDLVSKVFILHTWDPVFGAFATTPGCSR